MADADDGQRFELVAAGFNDFGQLRTEDDAAAEGHFRLLTFASLPKLHVSSTWDSTYVLAVEQSGATKKCTKGRWASIVPLVEKELLPGERVASIAENCKDVIIVLTTGGRVVAVEHGPSVGGCKLSVAAGEMVDVISLAALSSGGAYVIGRDGRLHACQVGRAPLGLTLGVHVPVGVPVLSVSCGADHALLLTATRSVMSFGLGTRGQLGHGDIMNRREPTVIEALEGVPITAVACGLWHSVVLSDCGDVYSWGWNDHGQVKPFQQANLQSVVSLPVLVDPGREDEEFCSISCGARHSAAVATSGGVYVWGWGYYGQILDLPTMSYKSHSVVCGPWCTFVLVELPRQEDMAMNG